VFLGKIKEAFDANPGLTNLLLDPYFRDKVVASQPAWRRAVAAAVTNGVPVPAFSTALGYVIYFRLLARAGTTNLLLVTFLIPVSATLLGTMVLGERLAPHHVAGMALIALALAAIDGRISTRFRNS